MKRLLLASLMVVSFTALGQADSTSDTNANTNSNSNSTTSSTTSNTATDISGNYTCSGTTPDGQAYQNTTLNVTKNGQVYQLSWSNSKYGKYSGIGISVGDANNSVATYFAKLGNMGSGQKMGIVVYAPSSDGSSLQGSFAFQNSTTLGSETCTKSQPSNS